LFPHEFECLFLGVPAGFNNGFNDTCFGEGAGFRHWVLLSRGRLQTIGKGLVCQLRIWTLCNDRTVPLCWRIRIHDNLRIVVVI